MSEKVCAVCGKVLSPQEIRLNELGRRSAIRRRRYLCTECRQREYDEYMKAMNDLIKKF